MISFGDAQTKMQNGAQDRSAGALTFLKSSYNVGLHLVEDELGSFYTEETYTDTTTASNNSYKTPDLFVRLKVGYVTFGGQRYVMEEVQDEDDWQALQVAANTSKSDAATHIFIRRDRFEIYPTPTATAGNTITLIYEQGGKDLSFDDYNTGTITTLANGGVAVTASGSTFTALMAGRYFKVDSYPVWYKIASFGTTTTLTLDKKYTGVAIAAGTETYVIGEMPRIPESTHVLPIWYALMDYYQSFKQNTEKAVHYKALFEADLKRAKKTYKRRYSSNYIPGNHGRLNTIRNFNPNHYPTNITY